MATDEIAAQFRATRGWAIAFFAQDCRARAKDTQSSEMPTRALVSA